MDSRDEPGRDAPSRRRSGRPVVGDGRNGDVADAPRPSAGLRPLPPVPARFDRSPRRPPQPQPHAPYQPARPPHHPNGAAPNGIPPTAGQPARRGRHAAVPPAPVNRFAPAPATAPPNDTHDERCRKIDESLTRLTAAHAGMSEVDGANAAKRSATDANADGADPDEQAAEPSPVSRTQRRLVRGGKLLAVTTAAVLFLVAAAGWVSKLMLDGQIRPVAALDLTSASIVDAAGQAGAENFLLVGSDDLPGAAGSDSIMVVHLPADRSRTVLLSFPRDLEIDRPDCQRWDAASAGYRSEGVPAEPASKLTAAYEAGGPACLTKVIQQVTGLSVTRFIGIDATGFKDMVDAVQGVQICLEQPVIDGVLGVLVPDAGTSTVNGDRALELLRARNVRGDPAADYGQIQRQQRFLSALLSTAASNQMALDPTAARNFVAAFAAHSITDNAGLDELATLAQSMQGLDPATVSFMTAPTTGQPNERGNEVLRDADAKTLFAALREDTTLGETEVAALAPPTGGAPAGDAPKPSEVKVAVLNASERSGLASQVGTELTKLEFTVASVGNADAPAERTVIRYSADQEQQAKVLGAVVPDATLQLDESGPGVLQLALGTTFDGIVSPLANTAGSAGAPPATPAQPAATCR